MFRTRLLSGMVLTVILVGMLYFGGYVLSGITLLLSLIAYRELMKTCKLAGGCVPENGTEEIKKGFLGFSSLELIGYLGIIGYYVIMVFVEDRVYLLLVLFGVLMAFMALYVLTFPKFNSRDIMKSFFCFIYGPIMLTFIYMTRELPNGQYAVWMIFISSWICDTAAYCVGMLIGKHKLAPVLSPKKSIEGAVGGVVGSALVGGLVSYFVFAPNIAMENVTLWFTIIAAAGAVISQIGDLAASGIKRNEEIKDYGKLIPGHGGVMDRFDSVIFTAPIIYFLTYLLIRG